MTLDDLTQTTGEWLRGVGPLCDVVISSRIRLARNLAGQPFLSTATPAERTEIYRTVADAFAATTMGKDSVLIDVNGADPIDQEVLVERHLVSRQHVSAEGSRGVTVSSDETRALMINEEDHLRMQALRSGMQLDAVWTDVNAMDDALGAKLPFAFDRKLGFLTACPTNVGTGIRVSVMLHLPALKITKEIERVARAARDLRLAVRGMLGEGTDVVGDLYQISNQTTLGKSEPEIIKSFSEQIIPKIVEYERTARDSLVHSNPHTLDDRIWRAHGILSNARRITNEETQMLLSIIRMGIHLERYTVLDVPTLNELFLHTQPAHLQKRNGRALSEDERDVLRAEYLRTRFGHAA